MAHVGSSPSLRWPIRWRLPLLICGLLLATVAAFASVAYWYLEQALLDATQQRLQNVARQMASLLSTSAQQRLDEARRLAGTPEIVALLVSPLAAAVWLLYAFAYQQLENYLIQPVVYRQAVHVSALTTIVAVLVGGTLLGVLGALLAIPAVAAIQLVVHDLRRTGETG